MIVLIIERDNNLRDALAVSFYLRWPELTVTEVKEKDSAIEFFQTAKPDIVIMNPEKISDIEEVCSHNVPVIVISVHTEDNYEANCLHAGASDYLQMPVQAFEELHVRMRAILKRESTKVA